MVNNIKIKSITCSSCYLLFLYLFVLVKINAQDYFQQRVNYEINCKLDDQNHKLSGHIQIKYLNNSPDVLDRLGMHLWPNAYSNKKTNFAKQKLNHRSTEFYDAPISDMGSINHTNITIDGLSAELIMEHGNSDIAWLKLPKILKPKEEITINADFELKIPKMFSRLGHVGQSYQMTQWYMKPAVYDRKGWHLMHYLDQGEFYSELGNYKVTITLPENYIVAATGIVQEESEYKFLERQVEKAKEKSNLEAAMEEIIESSNQLKTISYYADNVHDFAWFADKFFYVDKSNVLLPSGKKVDTWVFYKSRKHWNKAIHFLDRSIAYYSECLGEYPWPQASIVHGPLSAGGGMEYPMISIISDITTEKSLDQVICHEVGHNWLQGVLATNERDYPWMDEGINSYYEKRYLTKFYGNSSIVEGFIGRKTKLDKRSSETELLYQIIAHLNLDEHPNQSSEDFNALSYGYDIYVRTAELFKYLEEYLGIKELDRIMRQYYETWKFKHPYPEDLKNIFENNNLISTNWFFNDILNSNRKIDYKLCKVKKINGNYTLVVKNKKSINAPLNISFMKGDSIINQLWVDGFESKKTIEFPIVNVDRLVIDHRGKYFDYNKSNNFIRTKGIFKKFEPLSLSIKNIYSYPGKTNIWWHPSVLWNDYDGFMIGVGIRSPIAPRGAWNYKFLPHYAIRSRRLSGISDVNYRINIPDAKIDYIKVGVEAKSFSFYKDQLRADPYNYFQIKPYAIIDFTGDRTKFTTSKLSYEYFIVQDLKSEFSNGDSSYSLVRKNNTAHKLKYYYSNPSILGPFEFISQIYFEKYKSPLNDANSYLRLDLEASKGIRWSKKRYFNLRLAASIIPTTSAIRVRSIASRTDHNLIRGSAGIAYQPFMDYYNEYSFLGRTNSNGIWSQQIIIQQGGFKIAPGIAQRTNLGNTNSFLAALNLSSDLPIKYIGNILRPYFDVAAVNDNLSSDSELNTYFSGGIQLRVLPEFLSIYFPIIHSKEIRQIYKDNGGSYFDQVCFSLNLKFEHLKNIANFVQ